MSPKDETSLTLPFYFAHLGGYDTLEQESTAYNMFILNTKLLFVQVVGTPRYLWH